MAPTDEYDAERNNLDVVQFGEYDEDNIYVFYPKDAADEDLKTMWIRSPESDTIQLADQK
ncbi:hypothetical protein SAMN05216388_101843 [Halorientalis persicus]|uniref:Uncharacterized protein n=1 Tax=Halorientalis persicus TaxID=1367881 RepID=A0A1H8S9K9_9EURY|nr:hypothetical protein [Halorientalis persicus]SEO75351.1 hypothetical protein SAMN05216388_101843 [Halorientalis persicus]